MSTHRGDLVRVSRRNKKRLEERRDLEGLQSQNDVIDELLNMAPLPQKKKRRGFFDSDGFGP